MARHGRDYNQIKKSSYRAFCYIFLFVFATSANFFLSPLDDRNYLLIAMLIITTPLLVFIRRMSINELLLIIFLIFIFATSFFHIETKWASNFYLLLFISSYVVYSRALKKSALTTDQFLVFLKYLISLYFGVLVVQQVCVAFGVVPPLAGNYEEASIWKLSSIAAEPSHASMNVAILAFCYLDLRKFSGRRLSDSFIFIMVLWVLLSNGSATGVIFALLFLLHGLGGLSPILLLMAILFFGPTLLFVDIDAVSRAYAFLTAIPSFDFDYMVETDHSASYRILPSLLLLANYEPLTFGGLFGVGNTVVANYLFTVMPGTPEGHVAGGLVVTLVQNGALPILVFLYFLFREFRLRFLSIEAFFITVLFFSLNGLNNQILWFAVLIFATKSFVRASAINKRLEFT